MLSFGNDLLDDADLAALPGYKFDPRPASTSAWRFDWDIWQDLHRTSRSRRTLSEPNQGWRMMESRRTHSGSPAWRR